MLLVLNLNFLRTRLHISFLQNFKNYDIPKATVHVQEEQKAAHRKADWRATFLERVIRRRRTALEE